MDNNQITEFKQKLLELNYLKSALEVLHWDQEVFMPKKGAALRAQTMAHLAGLLHERFTSIDDDGMLSKLKEEMEAGSLLADESVIVREVWREYEREKKLPGTFVKELTEACSVGNAVWIEARKTSDFTLYQPYLERIITLKQQEANYVGYDDTPYDALIDTYEPGMTIKQMTPILNDVKNFLVPFISKIKGSPNKTDLTALQGRFSRDKQVAFNNYVAKTIGYDFEAGRLDMSTHPFSTGFHPGDVRITTRFHPNDIFYSLLATIHETGHALYEQGIPAENFGTPLGESISLGIHESQSMIWENMVGRNKPFWSFFFPKLAKEFKKPFSEMSFEDFYRTLNTVTPSFIRVEADEVTYNLHIILRYEIEQALIEGKLAVHDLPDAWNKKMKDYLDITVPDDAHGVLQDIHWSHGSIGYFPTYTLGKLYSAQFYAAAKRAIPDIEDKFAQGYFTEFREWLRKNIHIHGKYFSAETLSTKVTGEALSSRFFINYIGNKYQDIYTINNE